MASTIQKAFNDFAHTLCDDLTKGRVTFYQACERLQGFGYKVTDSGCWYRTYTVKKDGVETTYVIPNKWAFLFL